MKHDLTTTQYDQLIEIITEAGYPSIRGYQLINKQELEPLAMEIHGRRLKADGAAGPATLIHAQHRRCQTPDYAHNELIQAARWPNGCTDIGIYVDAKTNPTNSGLTDAEVLGAFEWACARWNAACNINLFVTDNVIAASAYARFAALTGSTLAWSHLADNTCSASKQQRYDTRRWNLQQFRQTVLHEIGHLIGLPHSRGQYVMNPTIIESITGLTPHDVTRAQQLGYGPSRPAPPPTPTPPPLPPQPQPKEPDLMQFLTLIQTLLTLFANCNPEGRENAMRPSGKLARRLAIRRATLDVGEDWREVRASDEAKDFIENGFNEHDVDLATQLIATAEANDQI